MWEGGRDLDGMEAVEYCDKRLFRACDMCAGNVSAEGCAGLNWDGDEWSPLCEVEAASAGGSEENAWADMVSGDAPPTHAQPVKLVAVARISKSCRCRSRR